jgi:hypothetical protein
MKKSCCILPYVTTADISKSNGYIRSLNLIQWSSIVVQDEFYTFDLDKKNRKLFV